MTSWISEIEARLQWIQHVHILSSEGKELNDIGRWINHAREDVAALLEAVKIKDQALETIVLRNNEARRDYHTAKLALNFTPKGFEAKGNE